MGIKQKLFFIAILLMISISGTAQNLEINSSVSASGYLSTEGELPFWMVVNQNGGLSSQTDGLFEGATKGQYFLSENNKASFTTGVSFFLRNGVEDKLQRNELYLQFENSWVRATLGAKNPTDRFQGLSTVNDNFLLSGNARAIPGVLLETATPISIFKNINIEGAIGHYEMNDDRFVKRSMLHYKKLYANWQLGAKSQIRLGVEHYAQWGGTSPTRGKQPSGFTDFIDIFFAKGGGENAFSGDQQNALGNHLGIYNLEYNYRDDIGTFKLYHQHPFEDGSGTALKNFPDGTWGFYFKPNKEEYTGFLDGLLLEYIHTTNQSGSGVDSGNDDYFFNGIYSSGWTYEQNIIGLPLFNRVQRGESYMYSFYNRIKSIHIGISSTHKNWSFLSKLSYLENLDSFIVTNLEKIKNFYSILRTTYSFENYGNITLTLSFDYSDLNPNNYGTGLTYNYNF